jgi:hypothetical protein
VAEFRPRIDELRKAGVDVAVIGSGAPNFARGFKEQIGLDAPIFSDQKLAAYQAASMHRGILSVLNPAILLKIKAVLKYRQRKIMGDATQQGGVLVVRPDGTMPYSYLSRYPGDHAPPDQVVAAALAAARA